MKKLTFLLIAFSCVFASCHSHKKGPMIVKFKDATDFPTASIAMTSPTPGSLISSGGKVHFGFNVVNYQLTAQTDTAMKTCANSAQGQHIHFILNDKPYTALYKPERDTALADGHYVCMAFLSRSYHESIKHQSAYALSQFDIGSKKGDSVDLTKPLLIYSRPKGVYKGKDTKKILLDFYLVNADLSETGNKVIVTLNGTVSDTLKEWTGYLIKGLPMGENAIKLELVDKDGKLIPGPYNSVERKFILEDK